jgi:hypothetical protein
MRQLCLVFLVSVVAVFPGCSQSEVSTPTVHIPTSPTTPTEPVVNVAGNWVGTLEYANGISQPISMVVTQFGNCVDGSWRSADGDLSGAISGFALKDSWEGQISIDRRSGGGCLSAGNVAGEVGSSTLRWTGSRAAPIAPCASGGIYQDIVITMRRQ